METILTEQVVNDVDDLRQLRIPWDTLHTAADSANPFTQWLWAWHWWHAFRQSNRRQQDQLHIVVFRDVEGVVRAIVPFILTRWRIGPFSLCAFRLYGFVGSFTELRAPLVWPGWETSAAAGIARVLQTQRRCYHWCILDGLVEGSPLETAFAAHSKANDWTKVTVEHDYVLVLPSTWEAFRSGLKRNIKESLRHCYNSLARDGHQWTFEAVSEGSALSDALDDFFRLHTARAAMHSGKPHPDHFHAAERKAFLRSLGVDLAREGKFMVCRLHVNGAVVATRCAFRLGDSLYLYYSGFEPEWGRYSVMTLLTAECIRMAISSGARTVNLSPGIDVGKTRWGPQEYTWNSLRIVSPTSTGRFLEAFRQTRTVVRRRGSPRQVLKTTP